MNDHTIQMVKESFDLVEPIAPQVGALVFDNLFAVDRSLEGLLARTDVTAPADTLMQTVTVVIARLGEPELLFPMLRSLGQQQAAFGVRDAHYDAFGAAWLASLRQTLGVAFTPEVEEAWVEVYGVVATAMKEASGVPA